MFSRMKLGRRAALLRTLALTAAAGAWLALGPGGAAVPEASAAAPAQISLTPCYSFQTIDIGQVSYFGYACGDYFESRSASAGTQPCYADVAHPAFEAIIRDKCTFASFWAQHSTNPMPSVDFSREVVIVVIAGTKPHGHCVGIEITAVASSDCGAKIHIRERIPCPGEPCTRVITNPYHIIKICKDFIPFGKPTCFERRLSEQPNCNIFMDCVRPIED